MPRRSAPPSYHQGFARYAGESAYPDLWRGLMGAWVPALGPTGITATILRDVSGHHRDGAVVGSMTADDWVIGNNPRMPGYVLDFATSNDKVVVPDHPDLNPGTGDFTITGWFNAPADADFQYIITKRNDDDTPIVWPYFVNVMDTGELRFRTRHDAEVDSLITTGTFDDGLWHSFVAVRHSGGKILYVDDLAPISNSGNTGDDLSNTQDVIFGTNHNATPSGALVGQIGSVMFYKGRAFNANEARLVYDIPLAPFILRQRVRAKAPAAAAVSNPWHVYAQQ